jgi:hypothetical protein
LLMTGKGLWRFIGAPEVCVSACAGDYHTGSSGDSEGIKRTVTAIVTLSP